MKLKILVENNTYIDNYYLGEPATSFYIEDNDERILFDLGYSDVFLKNAIAMNIDLSNTTTIVLSHGHNDHTGGLQYMRDISNGKIKLIGHPNVFEKKRYKDLSISSPIDLSVANDIFDLKLSKVPIEVSENIIFLGEIERTNDFENMKNVGERYANGSWENDFLMDDSAMVYKSSEGLCIITGCSHAGICNIIEYAKKVCKEERIHTVIGGFHLFEDNEQTRKTIDYLRKANIENLYPCHCTSFIVKAMINKYIKVHEVGVGLSLEF